MNVSDQSNPVKDSPRSFAPLHAPKRDPWPACVGCDKLFAALTKALEAERMQRTERLRLEREVRDLRKGVAA